MSPTTEVECKILEIDVASVRKKLLELGAEERFSGLLKVQYFDFPDGRIHGAHELLRLRQFIPESAGKRRTELVYKCNGRIEDGCKLFDETELFLDAPESFQSLSQLFVQLGLQETTNYEKRRSEFFYKKWKFELDEYPKIPPFIEIEAQDTASVKEGIALLGLESHLQTPETINGVLEQHYPTVKLNDLHFS